MGTLTLTGLDEATLGRLRARAAEHGKSEESEAVDILKTALPETVPTDGEWIGSPEYLRRVEALDVLAAIGERISGRTTQTAVEMLRESREMRTRQLLGDDDSV